MTQAFNFNLMDDTFTLVSFLRTHDAAIVHSRFLSPLAVTALNALLCPRDPLPARMQQRTERRTERLRFIHFLCEADRLVAPTGRFLKPTLRIKRWLTASPLERAAQLFRAAFPDQPRAASTNSGALIGCRAINSRLLPWRLRRSSTSCGAYLPTSVSRSPRCSN